LLGERPRRRPIVGLLAVEQQQQPARLEEPPRLLRLTDPFGMCELQRSFSARDTLVVTPPVQHLPVVALSGEWTGSGESRARSVASAGEDDAATREYHQGDDLRRVHWRSTARLGQLMVRREEQAWDPSASIVLDSRWIASPMMCPKMSNATATTRSSIRPRTGLTWATSS
jgi:uncharacterized protein (DUF58 family)